MPNILFLKFLLIYFFVILFQTGCAANSINRDDTLKKPIVNNFTKSKNKHTNKNSRKTLSGHGKVADDIFLNKN